MERDLPLPKTPKGTILALQRPGIRGMSDKVEKSPILSYVAKTAPRGNTAAGAQGSRGNHSRSALAMLQITEDPANSQPLPVAAGDLEELARWVPKKEMALLIDLFERAQQDPDLARPALLLYWAYAQKVARMLDQDPFPSVTRKIADQLQQLSLSSGL
jgi:hypothetical protein